MATHGQGRRAWMLAFLGAVILCGLLVAANIWLSELRPDTAWGLGYGIAATVLLVVVALFGARRRFQRLASRFRLGSAALWLRVHFYGGALFLLLVFMHSGFALPRGTLTSWLWGLTLWTTFSGWLGLAIQRWVPRRLASGLSVEVLYERIPELVEGIRERAEALAASACEPIRALYSREVAPALDGPRSRWVYYLDITGGIRSRLRGFDHLRGFLRAEDRPALEELQQLFETKLEIDAHYTLQRPLRWWLVLHVPTSAALLVLVALHIATSLLY